MEISFIVCGIVVFVAAIAVMLAVQKRSAENAELWAAITELRKCCDTNREICNKAFAEAEVAIDRAKATKLEREAFKKGLGEFESRINEIRELAESAKKRIDEIDQSLIQETEEYHKLQNETERLWNEGLSNILNYSPSPEGKGD